MINQQWLVEYLNRQAQREHEEKKRAYEAELKKYNEQQAALELQRQKAAEIERQRDKAYAQCVPDPSFIRNGAAGGAVTGAILGTMTGGPGIGTLVGAGSGAAVGSLGLMVTESLDAKDCLAEVDEKIPKPNPIQPSTQAPVPPPPPPTFGVNASVSNDNGFKARFGISKKF